MADWQERITRETAPAIRAEHDLRYRLAAPLIAGSTMWADLGCGTGLAAARALQEGRPEHAVLVDLEADVVAGAAEELGISHTRQLTGDLTKPELLAEIREELLSSEGDRVVTSFEVIEHLEAFLPMLEWSVGLARERLATVVISVPNDAFWAIENPYHATSWSEGAFDELVRLLPEQRTLLRQVGLTGSAMLGWDAQDVQHELTVRLDGDSAVATHFIAAFGPRHSELAPTSAVVQTDLHEQRRWERQRESNLALAEQEIAEQGRRIATQQDELKKFIAQFDDWRAYIHELERELGKPLAGTEEAAAAERAAGVASKRTQ